MSEFNDRVIEEFRANHGRVDSAGFGSNLVLLHTRGARTGAERVNPALSLRDGADWLVVASAKGAPRDPAWAINLRAHPDAEIEAPIDGEVHTIAVRAAETTGTEYAAAFARFIDRSPSFRTYQRRAARQLPVIRLAPRAASTLSVDDPAASKHRLRRPATEPTKHLARVAEAPTATPFPLGEEEVRAPP